MFHTHIVDRKMTFARCSSVQEGYVILFSVFKLVVTVFYPKLYNDIPNGVFSKNDYITIRCKVFVCFPFRHAELFG